ncbi:MAG: metal-binding protein, partial [Erythrobacter sp.]
GNPRLLALRDSRSPYTKGNLMELAGVSAEPLPLSDWEGARCSPQFCTVTLTRGGREWVLLLGRNHDRIDASDLAAACREADIVVSERYLPRSCRPRWLKADRRHLERSGGLAIDLADRRIASVADTQGQHGWWQAPPRRVGKDPPRSKSVS